mmetsp:Transcript_14381/g.28711  ORF Transcript_14381/g.28711 Transcript_14381/m.28711 type:complete len:219 (-) Transcript_14381:688-1344(-)
MKFFHTSLIDHRCGGIFRIRPLLRHLRLLQYSLPSSILLHLLFPIQTQRPQNPRHQPRHHRLHHHLVPLPHHRPHDPPHRQNDRSDHPIVQLLQLRRGHVAVEGLQLHLDGLIENSRRDVLGQAEEVGEHGDCLAPGPDVFGGAVDLLGQVEVGFFWKCFRRGRGGRGGRGFGRWGFDDGGFGFGDGGGHGGGGFGGDGVGDWEGFGGGSFLGGVVGG